MVSLEESRLGFFPFKLLRAREMKGPAPARSLAACDWKGEAAGFNGRVLGDAQALLFALRELPRAFMC